MEGRGGILQTVDKTQARRLWVCGTARLFLFCLLDHVKSLYIKQFFNWGWGLPKVGTITGKECILVGSVLRLTRKWRRKLIKKTTTVTTVQLPTVQKQITARSSTLLFPDYCFLGMLQQNDVKYPQWAVSLTSRTVRLADEHPIRSIPESALSLDSPTEQLSSAQYRNGEIPALTGTLPTT